MATNYPGALDDGTSLANARAAGQNIPASDHNDLANAAIALETKVGTGSSSPATVGNVLTVVGTGQTSWQAPGAATNAYFNVKAYGAVGDGSHDDTTNIQSAINAALASNRGTGAVYFPAGTYKITASLNCSSATSSTDGKGVYLVGDGHEASQIFKTFSTGPAVKYIGFGGPSNHPTQFGGMVDITLNGNGLAGGLLYTDSAQQMTFRALSFLGSLDYAMELNTMQDSYFSQITYNNCGSTSKPVINIYGSVNGTANMLWFDQIRVETFLNGAVWIKRGAGATGGGNNGFFFTQCKFENYPTVNGDVFVADSYTQQLNMSQIFISIGVYNSGYSTPANGILFGDGSGSSPALNQASFRDIFMNAGPTAGIANSVIKLNGGSVVDGPIVIDNVSMTAACTTGIITMAGMSNADVQFSHIAGPSPKFGGDKSGVPTVVGTATLTAGAVTVNSSRVNSSSRIFLTRKGSNASAGTLYVGTITDYTSFVVNSTNASDTGTFHYWIVT